MTIIAAKAGEMAADGIGVCGGMVEPLVFPKIYHLPDGRLIGCTGYSADCWAAVQWFLAGEPKEVPDFIGRSDKDKNDEIDILMMKPDGTIWRSARGVSGFYPMPEGVAIGESNACNIARTAMALGKSAGEAVQVAADLCIHIRGPVQVERLGNGA